VQIAATSFISKSIAEAGSYSGAVPFAPSAVWLRNAAWLKNLDQLAERVKTLERRLNDIAERDK
jgi:UDP-3-O-[3-hydroxymyristoyl] glucosamine N-acyltransferase